MEIKKITKEMYEALKNPLPAEAVKPHPTKSFLSSIKAIYVTERLNEVFGCGSWRIKTEHITTTDKSMVVVKVTLEIPEYGVYYECYGGNDNGGENSRNFDLGDAFKGATTDAITKIGSYLGVAIDVFKGKDKSINQGTEKPTNEPEKWLNIFDFNQNFTKEWDNVMKGIGSGKIKSIADVRQYYKISKDVESKLKEYIK